jgi:hypothetical protein
MMCKPLSIYSIRQTHFVEGKGSGQNFNKTPAVCGILYTNAVIVIHDPSSELIAERQKGWPNRNK